MSLVYLAWWSLHGQHPVASGTGMARTHSGRASTSCSRRSSAGRRSSPTTRASPARARPASGRRLGYFVPTIPLFALGAVIAMSRHISEAPALLIAIAAGGAASILALLALTVDESDEAFANVYSGAVSLQNLLPRVPQRPLVGGVAGDRDGRRAARRPAELPAVPLPARLVLRPPLRRAPRRLAPAGRHYDSDAIFRAPDLRPEMLAAWLAGFCLYQWLSPQGPGWWTRLVAHAHPHASPWGGASLPSFAAAFPLAVLARASPGGPYSRARDRADRQSVA